MSEVAAGGQSLERLLRRRLVLLVGALWILASVLVWVGLRRQTSELLDLTLLEVGEQLMAMPVAALGQGESPPRVTEYGDDSSDIVYQVFDGSGRMRMRSHAAPTTSMWPDGASIDVDTKTETAQWYMFTIVHPDKIRRVVIGESQVHRQSTLWNLNVFLIAPLVVLLPLMGFALTRVLRRSFLTLEPVRLELSRREPHELHPVDVSGAPIELRPMLETVNAMMGRVKALVSAERAFAAHTAHELRTPLAAARAQAQRLAVEAEAEQSPLLSERATALMRQLDRLTRLASRLLQLARIDSGVALKREPVDLAQLVRLVTDEFGAAIANGQLVTRREAGVIAPVQGDVDALGIALRNLIDNALKHGGSAPRVRVSVGPHRIAVQDNGTGIAADQLSRLALPFERGPTVAEGSGLGLTMVQTVARQSGAALQFQAINPPDGEWRYEVCLTFASKPEPAPT
jgi:two-component system, OmpR family, sensor kinase